MKNQNIKTILALQLPAKLGDKKTNIEQLKKALGDRRPDFLVLPEVWATGWYPSIFKEQAESVDNKEGATTFKFLQSLAKERKINIIGGSYIKKDGDSLYNSCPIFDRDGKPLGHYDKNHLFALDGENEVIEPGKKLFSIDIEGLKIALSICYDIRFPELFRNFLNTDFDNIPHLFINMAAWPLSRKEHYTTLCKARAIENQAYFLGITQCGEIKQGDGVFNSGFSSLTDPLGKTIMQLSNESGEIFSTIDIDKIKKVRETYPNLSARREYCL
jgi:predicted amidohydrolase